MNIAAVVVRWKGGDEVERAVAQLKVKNAELEAAADEKDKFL